jgi:hypothetical protein
MRPVAGHSRESDCERRAWFGEVDLGMLVPANRLVSRPWLHPARCVVSRLRLVTQVTQRLNPQWEERAEVEVVSLGRRWESALPARPLHALLIRRKHSQNP